MNHVCTYLAEGLARSKCNIRNWVGGVSGWGNDEAQALLSEHIRVLQKVVVSGDGVFVRVQNTPDK